MRENFYVGDKVRLTKNMKRVARHPEQYESGVVTRIGSWGIVDVQWNGIDHPIEVRFDEIELDTN